jgi:predicted enzyme related to lactoylglutathione lyase
VHALLASSLVVDIVALQPERAMHFYSQLLAWSFEPFPSSEDLWHITGPAFAGSSTKGVLRRQRNIVIGPARFNGFPPGHTFSFVTTQLAAFLARAEVLGGSLAAPVLEVPGIGKRASVRDTEGNVFSVVELLAQH